MTAYIPHFYHISIYERRPEGFLRLPTAPQVTSACTRVESTRRWPLFVAHELAAFIVKVNVTAASTIEPQSHRGEERAAEVTLLTKKPAPTPLRAGFFERFGFDMRCNSGMGWPSCV